MDLKCVRGIFGIEYRIESNEIMRPRMRPKIRPKTRTRSKISDQYAKRNINIGIDYILLDSFYFFHILTKIYIFLELMSFQLFGN